MSDLLKARLGYIAISSQSLVGFFLVAACQAHGKLMAISFAYRSFAAFRLLLCASCLSMYASFYLVSHLLLVHI